jgi:hypothetical protein
LNLTLSQTVGRKGGDEAGSTGNHRESKQTE